MFIAIYTLNLTRLIRKQDRQNLERAWIKRMIEWLPTLKKDMLNQK